MPRNYRSLKGAKIRPDWNKYTLYNLSRLNSRPVDRARADRLTFFQQKWRAKSALRAYHSPYVREGQWEGMFDRRLPAVVAMDPRYLARSDGSELASGRGAGLIQEVQGQPVEQQGQSGLKKLARTPYMSMTFFPLERRLDTAIWRALFASSTRQARQMVVHGGVKVNGKKMIYPGYLLNPGDMFQVEVDRVLYATGARKATKDASRGFGSDNLEDRHPLIQQSNRQTSGEQRKSLSEALDAKTADTAQQEAVLTANETSVTPQAPTASKDANAAARSEFKKLRDRARALLEEGKRDISGKRLAELRSFARSVQSAMSTYGRKSDAAEGAAAETVEEFEQVLNRIVGSIPNAANLSTAEASAQKEAVKQADEEALEVQRDSRLLAAALTRARENPVDSTKPYLTPWRPRPYMSAFAFIPRYLEVNQNICSAVYIRHPVARPGLSEVPSPFDYETSQLAFNYYLRRR